MARDHASEDWVDEIVIGVHVVVKLADGSEVSGAFAGRDGKTILVEPDAGGEDPVGVVTLHDFEDVAVILRSEGPE